MGRPQTVFNCKTRPVDAQAIRISQQTRGDAERWISYNPGAALAFDELIDGWYLVLDSDVFWLYAIEHFWGLYYLP